MRCSKCGIDIDESIFLPPLTYCPYCGQTLEASSREPASKEILFCPHCGQELGGKVNFCPYCGREIARSVTTYEVKQEAGEVSQPADFEAEPAIKAPAPKRRQDKLYKQWMKYADLPQEEIPSEEISRFKPKRERLNLQRLPVLYILLGVFLVMFFVGLVLLLVRC